MASLSKLFMVSLSAATLAGSLTVSTPAAAQWGWGPGWGYGYNNGAAVAGAAIGGLALGALLGAAVASQDQYAEPYYDAPPLRRGTRLCPAWQPIYDAWGNFLRYQRVRVAC